MINLTFSSEDPGQIRSDVAKLFGMEVLPTNAEMFVTGQSAVTDRTDSSVGVEQVKPEKPARGRGRPRSSPQTIEGEVPSKTETAAPQPGPETAAQDKADEAASEQKPGPKVYTIDDVRNSAGAYVKKWGMEAASVDLVPCMVKAVGVGKMSELGALNDAAKFEAAVKAIDAAVASEARYPTEG